MKNIQYLSTRGATPLTSFQDAVMTGLAPDGGLFLPDRLPDLSGELAGWGTLLPDDEVHVIHQRVFKGIFRTVVSQFISDGVDDDSLESIIDKSYKNFNHHRVTPLVMVGGVSVCELFHGPTLAFKDVALQFLGNLFEHFLEKSEKTMTVLGATSGDTGSAAIHALKGRKGVEVFILFPDGRVSPMQQRQMTTVSESNIHTLAVKGSFDDAQAIVKALFNDQAFNSEVSLGAINSINWARVMAQITYFFHAYLQVLKFRRLQVGELVDFSVPTGNFGHIYAGLLAKRMGLPIGKLILATNANDILTRFVTTGRYEKGPVRQTLSPSMDIQVASNFERYLFDLSGQDANQVKAWLDQLNRDGGFQVSDAHLAQVQKDFVASTVEDQETLKTIEEVHRTFRYTLDPHSAIAYCAAQKHQQAPTPVIAMATAHPAKFSDAIVQALGAPPELPPALKQLSVLSERYSVLEAQAPLVQRYVRKTLKRPAN